MGKVKSHEKERKSRGRDSTTITITIIIPFLVGRPPPGKWFSSLRLCGGSGLGEKKTLNTSVVGTIRNSKSRCVPEIGFNGFKISLNI